MADNPLASPGRAPYASLLRAYLAPDSRRAALLLVLLVAGAALTLISPYLLAEFINVAVGANHGDLLWLGAQFLGVAILNQVVTVITNYLGTDIGLGATNRLRTDLMLHCLGLDMSFHNSTTPGTLIERIDGDTSRLNQFLSNFAPTLIRNGLLLVGALVASALIDWRAGGAVLVLIILVLAGSEISRRAAVPTIRREREASAQLFSVIEERLAGAEDMRANGANAYVLRRFTEQSRVWAWAHTRAHTVGSIAGHVAQVAYAIGMVLTLGLAVWLVGAGAITVGTAYALFRYVELIRWPIHHLGRQIEDLQQAGAAIVRLQELFGQRSMIPDSGSTRLSSDPCDVAFQHVRFAYPPSGAAQDEPARYALDDLSFHLPAGATLGLLGRTGSGKTTISRMLLRFYMPSSGRIELGNMPIEGIALESLRERVGLVTQDVQIFNATVRDNLRLFDPAIEDERIRDAIAAVELDEWLFSLPNGLDTVLPPGGGMSAGQSQLLAVARVLLRDPALVILDEASSRLDPATEVRLEHALGRLLNGRTGIIIAHRLATVQRADYIMVLEHGRCVEFGLREALANDENSHFAQLMRVGMEEALA